MDINFTSSTAEVPKEFRSDQKLVFRILANLLSNAIIHASRGSSVEVDFAPGEKAVRFSVSDRGPGIPDEEKDRIFEKYWRRDSKVSSTGIGLSFCRMAARALKGKIWAEDRQGGGSRFVLELPRHPPSAKAAAQPPGG